MRREKEWKKKERKREQAFNTTYVLRVSTRTTHINTVCPRSGHTFYKVTYHIKLVTTSWTHNSQKVKLLNITKYIIYLIKNFQWIFRHKVIFVDFMRNKKYWLCISLTKELRQKNCDLKPSKHISLIIILIYTLYNYRWRCSTFLLTKSSHWTKKLIIRHFTGCPNVSINKKKALLVEKFQSTKNAENKARRGNLPKTFLFLSNSWKCGGPLTINHLNTAFKPQGS